MKTEITAKEYKNIYEVCDWNPNLFSIVLNKLKYSNELTVIGDLWLTNNPIQVIVNITNVKGNMYLSQTPIYDLGKLQYVEGGLYLWYSTSIVSLGMVEYVGNALNLEACENFNSVGNLKHVGGDFILTDTPFANNIIDKIDPTVKDRDFYDSNEWDSYAERYILTDFEEIITNDLGINVVGNIYP